MLLQYMSKAENSVEYIINNIRNAPCFPDENQHQPEQTIHFSFEGSACSMTQVKSSSEGQRGVLTRNGAARRGACGGVSFMFLRRV